MSINDKDQGSGRCFKISDDPFTVFQGAGLNERDPTLEVKLLHSAGNIRHRISIYFTLKNTVMK